jgi:hypothetical protein
VKLEEVPQDDDPLFLDLHNVEVRFTATIFLSLYFKKYY